VEDSLWSDSRFMDLGIKVGDKFKAIGIMVIAWKVAQKFWCPERNPIPEEAFLEAGLPEALIEVHLAERLPSGIRMRGSEEHFKWWFEKQAAGIQSAKVRRKKYGSAQPRDSEHPLTAVEQRSNSPEALPLPLPLPLPLKKEEENTLAQSTAQSPPAIKFDFDTLYQQYPRKLGKKRGMGICRRRIKTKEDYAKLEFAIKKYSRYCGNFEAQFIKHFDTFMNSWEDWLDSDAGKSGVGAPLDSLDMSVLWGKDEPA
jgi:hypothetical protein